MKVARYSEVMVEKVLVIIKLEGKKSEYRKERTMH